MSEKEPTATALATAPKGYREITKEDLTSFESLGKGKHGHVYKAHWKPCWEPRGKSVAVKKLAKLNEREVSSYFAYGLHMEGGREGVTVGADQPTINVHPQPPPPHPAFSRMRKPVKIWYQNANCQLP